jgi:hypothetical protein
MKLGSMAASEDVRQFGDGLAHLPEDAQADFGEAMMVIGGVDRKAHYLAVDLPQCRRWPVDSC